MVDKYSYQELWRTLNDLHGMGAGNILRHHHEKNEEEDSVFETIEGMALYSMDQRHRYLLSRVWDRSKPMFGAVLLNPSTATEATLDPTVSRVLERVKKINEAVYSYGGMFIFNIFAYRATDPKDMRSAADPVGFSNDWVLSSMLPHMRTVMCGWGNHGEYRDRGKSVRGRIKMLGIRPLILGLTKQGHPKHPLYLSYKTKMHEWAE